MSLFIIWWPFLWAWLLPEALAIRSAEEPDQAALQHSLAEGDKIIPETVFGEDADPVILRLQKGKHPGVILSQSYENTDVYGGGVVISDYAPNGEVAKKITDPTGAHVLEIDQRDVSHWNLISVLAAGLFFVQAFFCAFCFIVE